jgi:hypothetical protein
MNTRVIPADQIHARVRKFLTSSQDQLKKILKDQSFIVFNDRIIKLSPSDVLRGLSELTLKDTEDETLRNLLLNSIVSSEGLWSSSGIISAVIAANQGQQALKLSSIGLSFSSSDGICLSDISKHSRRVTSTQALKIVSSIIRDEFAQSLVEYAVTTAGGAGRIHISREESQTTIVSRESGYTFESAGWDEVFSQSTQGERVVMSNPKIAVIDGIVEQPHELHSILESSYRTGQACIVVARGFHGDVSSTLASNYINGHMRVIPCRVAYDEVGANQINDISSVTGSRLVTALMGDVIGELKWDELCEVQSAEITENCLKIVHRTGRDRVSRVRSDLLDRYQTAKIDLERDILDKRLASLIGDGIKITLGNDLGDRLGITRDRIEMGIRMFRDLCKFGAIPTCVLLKTDLELAAVILLRGDITSMPAPTMLAGIETGRSTAEMLGKIGGWIAADA